MENEQFRSFLSLIDSLTDEQKSLFKSALNDVSDYKKVIALLESRFIANKKCVHCGAEHLHRFGFKHGLQRYRCVACGRTFNALTGTPLAHLRKKEEWLNMAMSLKESLTVEKTAKRCAVAKTTAFRWRHRFLRAMSTDMAPKLIGIAEADETYFLESFKGRKSLDFSYPSGRKARKRGGKAMKSGISKEQIPVLVARDRFGATVDSVLADQSAKSVKYVLGAKVGKDNILCIDGGNALWSFVNSEKVPFRIIPATKHVDECDPLFHIQNVNAYHSRLKLWMMPFRGVATKYLSNYLGWRRMHERKQTVNTPAAWVQAAARPLINI